MNWKCFFNYHLWEQTVPGSGSNPYDCGKAKCTRCGKTANIYNGPSSTGITFNKVKPMENMEGLEELAEQGYMEQNFPDGGENYPDGFAAEMWFTCSREVRESWYNYARKQLAQGIKPDKKYTSYITRK